MTSSKPTPCRTIRQRGGLAVKYINWPIIVIALAFYFHQNAYFGWNRLPQSEAELIADGITLLLLALAFVRPLRNADHRTGAVMTRPDPRPCPECGRSDHADRVYRANVAHGTFRDVSEDFARDLLTKALEERSPRDLPEHIERFCEQHLGCVHLAQALREAVLEEVLQNYIDACEAFLDCVVVLEKISGAETVDEAKRLAAEHLRATQRIRSAFVGDAQEPTGGTIRAAIASVEGRS